MGKLCLYIVYTIFLFHNGRGQSYLSGNIFTTFITLHTNVLLNRLFTTLVGGIQSAKCYTRILYCCYKNRYVLMIGIGFISRPHKYYTPYIYEIKNLKRITDRFFFKKFSRYWHNVPNLCRRSMRGNIILNYHQFVLDSDVQVYDRYSCQ